MLISFFSTCGLSSVDRVDRVDEDVGGTDKLLRRRGDCQEMFTMSGVIPVVINKCTSVVKIQPY